MSEKTITLFACILLGASAASAQSRLTGTVTDATGAVVVGAHVAVQNLDTGIVTATASNTSGVYSISLLEPGRYSVSCEVSGFKKFIRSGIVLETGRAVTVNMQLELGSLADTVTVSASAPLLDAESGAAGQLIENKFILSMPIQSRRSAALVRMMGNISFTSEDGGQAIPRFSMAGGRSLNQMWYLDGGVSQSEAVLQPQLALNPPNEALQEFRAIANNYPAEYGRSAGGVIVMTTRSGTNEFHGALYEWLRNDKLNARTFFDPGKAPLRFNIFGGSLGGPVRRNKIFFFYNYEGGRQRTGVTVTQNVPQPAEVQGDFSARRDIKILDPATRTGTTAAQPFAGNLIPASRLDPIGKTLASFYPAPNVAGNDPTRAPSNNFRANASDSLNQNFHTARLDYFISAQDRLFGRLAYVTAPEIYGQVRPVREVDNRAGIRENRHANVLLNWQRTLRPNLINEAKYMYSNRLYVNRCAGIGSGLNGKLGLNGLDPNALARITVAGHADVGPSNDQERVQTPILTHQVSDSVLWVKGNHSVKAGFDWRYTLNNDDYDATKGGNIGFTDRATNSGLASLLLGWAASGTVVDSDLLGARTDYFGAFVQDDWKVTRRLTLNLGLRWDLDTPRWEQHNRQSGFDPNPINPVSGTPGIVTFAGMNGVGKYAYDFDKNNVGPRFGFAYSPGGRAVIRGGYGISYNGPFQGGVPAFGNLGFSVNTSLQSPDGGFTPALRLSSGFPPMKRAELGPGFGAVAVGQTVTTQPTFMDRKHVNGYAQHWNLTLQKELPGALLLETAYLANVGHKLAGQNVNINQVPLVNGKGPARQDQRLRPFPQYANVTRNNPAWGNSTYHALNVKVEKRYSGGLNLLSNYTWSKFIDDVKATNELGGTSGNGAQHIDVRNLNKALSGSDLRHRLVFSTLYDLPLGAGRKIPVRNAFSNGVFGGWSIGAIFEARSGAPYGAIEQTNRLNAFSDAQRPNLLRDPKLPSDRPRAERIDRYFDTSAFEAPGDGNLGTAGRVNGIGPGYLGIDLSLQKQFQIKERVGLGFRADFMNFPNLPAFANPNDQRGSGNFGKIGSTLSSSRGRQIQLSLRLSF